MGTLYVYSYSIVFDFATYLNNRKIKGFLFQGKLLTDKDNAKLKDFFKHFQATLAYVYKDLTKYEHFQNIKILDEYILVGDNLNLGVCVDVNSDIYKELSNKGNIVNGVYFYSGTVDEHTYLINNGFEVYNHIEKGGKISQAVTRFNANNKTTIGLISNFQKR